MTHGLMKHCLPQEVNVLSVDVFDTLLLRNDKVEPRRFYEIAVDQAQLLAARGCRVAAADLFHARLLCARVAYQTAPRRCGERDAQLANIFKLMIDTLRLSNFTSDAELLRIELDYEKKNLRLNVKLKDFLSRQRIHRRVVLTSDIYFRQSELTELVSAFTEKCYDQIYASCDYSMTKKGGALFRLLCEKENCTPNQVLHMGDNLWSDVLMPTRMGLHAWHMPRSIILKFRRLFSHVTTMLTMREEIN